MALRNVFLMNVEKLRKKLEEDGFVHIYEWHDDPYTKYPPHRHKGRVGIYILKGDINFSLRNETIILSPGDYFEVPINIEHAAEVGDLGCDYVVGEMIEGDS